MIRIKALTMAAAVAAFFALPALAQDAKHSFKMATGWPGGPLMDIGAKAFA